MEKLLFKRLEKIEAAEEEDPDDPRPELADELLDGDRSAREIQDKLNMRMADARQKIAQYGVKANLAEVSAAELRREWEDYSVARKQSVYRGLIREILIHPATRPFNVWNPDRVDVLWRQISSRRIEGAWRRLAAQARRSSCV
ncbi:hypothetical protein [Streptomyces parvulus]